MKSLLVLASLVIASPVFSQTVITVEESYDTFTYETPCGLDSASQSQLDTCKVVETREPSGALRTRNIYGNRHSLTIKSWFDREKGFMTWDSHNKFEYKWQYKVSGTGKRGNWSYVMPGFIVQNISWD